MPFTILYVEDNQPVADAVKDTLEAAGWRVRLCADAVSGRGEIEGGARFDLLILEYLLGDVSGVELVRFVRTLPHRQQTPVVMFSGSYVESAARKAGANAFLRKPQDVGVLVETVKRLLDEAGAQRADAPVARLL